MSLITNALANPIVGLIGAGVQAYGQRQEGKAIATAESYNAGVARQQAANTITAANLEADKKRREAKSMMSTQRAQYLKAGVLLEGSPLEVMADTQAQYEMDIATINYNANIEKNRLLSEASFRDYSAKQAKQSSYLKSGATLLTAGADFASKYAYKPTASYGRPALKHEVGVR